MTNSQYRYINSIRLIGKISDESKTDETRESQDSQIYLSKALPSQVESECNVSLNEIISLTARFENIPITDELSGLVMKFSLNTAQRLLLSSVSVILDFEPKIAMEQGYQSWSPIRITEVSDIREQRTTMPNWVKGMYFADAASAGNLFMADQYMICKNDSKQAVVGSLSAFNHFSNVTIEDGKLTLNAILDNVEFDEGTYELDPLFIAVVDTDQATKSVLVDTDFDKAFNAYLNLWAETSKARVQRPFSGLSEVKNSKRTTLDKNQADLGWCSWYQYFWQLRPEYIDAAIEEGLNRQFDLIQIDDGYQSAVGDWLEQSDEFKGELVRLAKKINDNNMTAGIWTAPFLAGQNSAVYKEHPEWMVADRLTGEPQVAMVNPNWGGYAYALDTTNDEVLNFLVKTYAGLVEMGFNYHKIDFCYAASLDGVRLNEKKYTRAQALRMGLAAVREGIKDSYLLGCGCPFGPAVGIVDAMRVSADTAPYFEERIAWTGFNEASPSAYNALIASALRANLNARLFTNDPDCILLRKQDIMLDSKQSDLIMAVVGGVGNFEIISDDVSLLDDEDYSRLTKIRELNGATGLLNLSNLFDLPLVVDSDQTRLITDLWGKVDSAEIDLDNLTQGYELVISGRHDNVWARLYKKRN